jgi:predicted O-methyltransferase YrrM
MIEIINYIPAERDNPKLVTNKPSAWGDIPTVLKDIIKRFNINPNKALEFGVQYGYSTSALANYFEEVIGIDTFIGDIHAGVENNFFEETKRDLNEFSNIELIESTYQDFILNRKEQYDLIHVDIIHTYEDTFACGEWAVNNSNVVIFHDTESFPSVKQACIDLSLKYNLTFYNYQPSHGLGILIK